MKTRVRFLVVFAAMLTLLSASAKAQPTALAELFGNTGCTNCITPDGLYTPYADTAKGLVVINYHNNAPFRGDPFYAASVSPDGQNCSEVRNEFYGGSGGLSDPTGYVDGIYAGEGQTCGYQWIKETNTNISFASTLAPMTVRLGYGPSGIDTIHFTINGGSSHTQVVYYVAIKESRIVQPNSEGYGLPPGGLWNDIFRTMLPNGNGSVPFALGGTHTIDTIVYDLSQYLYNGNPANMVAVIFVQDVGLSPVGYNSHQIEAIDTISLAPSGAGVAQSSAPVNRLIVSQNYSQSERQVVCELEKGGEVKLTILDMLGRDVMNVFNGALPAGQTSMEINSHSLPAGCYFVELSLNGALVDNQKFMVVP